MDFLGSSDFSHLMDSVEFTHGMDVQRQQLPTNITVLVQHSPEVIDNVTTNSGMPSKTVIMNSWDEIVLPILSPQMS